MKTLPFPTRLAWRAILSSAFLVLSACGGGSGVGADPGGAAGASTPGTTSPTAPGTTPPGTPTPAGTPTYTLDVSPQPLSVEATIDDARAVTKSITIAGGSLSATGADGTVYTLTVPADALLADTTITMTPVAQFTRLPFNGSVPGLAHGVQLAPEGITFNTALTLHISLPNGATMPVDAGLPFSWAGTQRTVSLAQLDPASTGIDLKLLHFSGWAIARHDLGLSASLSGVRDRLGGTVEARLESAIAERIMADRDKGQPGLLSDADLAAYIAEFDAKVVKPRVAAAGTSCAAGRLAVETLISLSRQLTLLGIANTYQEQALALLVPNATICIDEEYRKCHDNHIVQDINAAALSMDRQAILLGRADGADWQAWRKHASQQMDLCHRYLLDVDSTAGNAKPGASGWDFSEHMTATVKLRLSGDPLVDSTVQIVGTDTLATVGYAMAYHDHCRKLKSSSPANSVLSVRELDIFPAKDGSLADFKLLYFATQNPSTHVWTDICAVPPADFTEQLFSWSSVYYVDVLGNPLYFSTKDGPFVDQWTIHQGQSTLAERDIAPVLVSGGQTFTAPTHFKLIHTPGE